MTPVKPGKPGWTDLKKSLADLDHAALLGLIRDLYRASPGNQALLHARFAQGADGLDPFKATIARWICPDVSRNQDISISKAKKAITEYRKGVGDPEGLAELTVYYCESCRNLLEHCGMDDQRYFDALVGVFKQALKAVTVLGPDKQPALIARLERVRGESHNWGYGVGMDLDALMLEYGFAGR